MPSLVDGSYGDEAGACTTQLRSIVPKPDNPISSSDTCLKAFGDCLVATNAGDTFVRVGVTDATSDGVINEDDDVEYGDNGGRDEMLCVAFCDICSTLVYISDDGGDDVDDAGVLDRCPCSNWVATEIGAGFVVSEFDLDDSELTDGDPLTVVAGGGEGGFRFGGGAFGGGGGNVKESFSAFSHRDSFCSWASASFDLGRELNASWCRRGDGLGKE